MAFRWEYTHQRAFEDIKHCIAQFSEHRRKPLEYGKDAPQIWIATDGCVSGVAGAVLQGDDWRKARVAAFYSAKLSAPQQNYATHEIEMLAGLETMMRHREILQGVRFKWLTDHRGLIHLLNQKGLTGRQARWMEKMSEFDFEPVYIAGTENVLSDALSRIYSNDAPGTVRAASEYTCFDDNLSVRKGDGSQSAPVLVGSEGQMAGLSRGPLKDSMRVSAVHMGKGNEESSKAFAKRMRMKPFVLHGPRSRELVSAASKSSPEEVAVEVPRSKRRGDDEQKAAEAPAQGFTEFLNEDVSGIKSGVADDTASSDDHNMEMGDTSLVGVMTSRHDGVDL